MVVLDFMLVFGIIQHVDVSLRGSVEVSNFNIHMRCYVGILGLDKMGKTQKEVRMLGSNSLGLR